MISIFISVLIIINNICGSYKERKDDKYYDNLFYRSNVKCYTREGQRYKYNNILNPLFRSKRHNKIVDLFHKNIFNLYKRTRLYEIHSLLLVHIII